MASHTAKFTVKFQSDMQFFLLNRTCSWYCV